jgi:hypothetical protein
MATLTAAEMQKIAKLFGSTPTLVSAWVTKLGATVTVALETDIRAELARWDAGTGTGVVWFTATESNEGFNKSATVTGGNPAYNLAVLLEWPYPVGAQGVYTMQIG